jgi:glycosyltransferase involved in cell wall biosynthesis
MIKVALVIRSLDAGGAEKQLIAVAKSLDKTRFDPTIITFYPGGVLERELDNCGIRIVCLNKSGRWECVAFFARFVRELRKIKPDVIYSYLDIPNVLALVAKPFCSRPMVIWTRQSADLDLRQYDRLCRFASALERTLANRADHMIVNSHAGRSQLVAQGFPADKLTVIQNGFDTEHFRPNREARLKVRREWGISDEQVLIGLVARFDPVKDHLTFLRAASLISESNPNLRFVCVGSGCATYQRKLQEVVEQLSLSGKILWAGLRLDMLAVYNAFDINVLSSTSEGYPNVVGEAMSCAVPCVVTDVGDAARIVGDTGFVCPPQDPRALADSLSLCLQSELRFLGQRARRRIEEHWNLLQLSKNTEKVFHACVRRGPAGPVAVEC